MKQDSRLFKQIKLKFEKLFQRKKKDDGVSISKGGSFAEPKGDFGKAEDLAKATMDVIQEYEMEDQCIIQSFSYNVPCIHGEAEKRTGKDF